MFQMFVFYQIVVALCMLERLSAYKENCFIQDIQCVVLCVGPGSHS